MPIATSTSRRLIAAALLGAFSLIAVAPQSASAAKNHGPWIRYKQPAHGRPAQQHNYRRYESRGSGSAGPAIAGFIGGLVVGSAIRHEPARRYHEPAYCPPPRRSYSYGDPYSHERFQSLSAYDNHWRRHRGGARIVLVFESGRSECVNRLHYSNGQYRDNGGQVWNDGDYDRDSRDGRYDSRDDGYDSRDDGYERDSRDDDGRDQRYGR